METSNFFVVFWLVSLLERFWNYVVNPSIFWCCHAMTAHVDVCVDGGCRDLGLMLLRKEFFGL